MLFILIENLQNGNSTTLEFYFTTIILLGSILFLFWIYYGTYYVLDQTHLHYYSGPIKGEIEIQTIREIVKGKSLWVGLKPATASKGLIIKYGKYDEIYISPATNDTFIRKILEIHPSIKITT